MVIDHSKQHLLSSTILGIIRYVGRHFEEHPNTKQPNNLKYCKEISENKTGQATDPPPPPPKPKSRKGSDQTSKVQRDYLQNNHHDHEYSWCCNFSSTSTPYTKYYIPHTVYHIPPDYPHNIDKCIIHSI
jgi:hypothetical protein